MVKTKVVARGGIIKSRFGWMEVASECDEDACRRRMMLVGMKLKLFFVLLRISETVGELMMKLDSF